MAYSKATFKCSSDKASRCFRPFWRGNVWDKWLPIRILYHYYYYYYYGSTTLSWALAAFLCSLSYTQSVELLGRGISPSQGLHLHTEQHKHRINAHNTDLHALSGIRTHDPSVRASEDSSCLRPLSHWDRRILCYRFHLNTF
jgi:hypothetical protein